MTESPLKRLRNAQSADEMKLIALEIIKHQPPYPSSLIDYALQHLDAICLGETASETIEDEVASIRSSSYFDAEWYSSTYHDRLSTITGLNRDNLITHYCVAGWHRGLNPSPTFNTKFYLEKYPDIAAAGINPLYHYLVQGKRESRMACPLPDREQDPYQAKTDTQYIRESSRCQLHFSSTSYRTVAFYLPQFHPIPENDEWWGKDFTEWTNVKPAKPLFNGHFQPHEPAELGHYIIEDSSILRRQAKLAQSYGVDAFCFYFYWFNGKTLLEKPIDIFLNDKAIEHQYCLCWANENWTRRWDGKEDDVLLAQTHSHDDDIAFIKHISKYLQDPRYLRIDGKPILLIYRPSLLPNPAATSRLWRDWCIESGIGDLHIVYTQSFECEHPTAYGCDAGVEFAPNIPVGYQGVTPQLVTSSVRGLNPNFSGKIFDWTGYIDRSNHFPHPGYPLYRCINPGWDNTARKGINSTIFINSSPRSFQHWALNALEDTAFAQGLNGLLFINAWNEWAEGAHLEPDQRYGYGYLEALRMARIRHKYKSKCKLPASKERPEPREIAIIIHAFYPEILGEIFDYWRRVPALAGACFIITAPPERLEECNDLLRQQQLDFRSIVLATENHGRDILPLYRVYDFILRSGIKVFCKLHTKKSQHRDDGDSWRNRLLRGLLDPNRTLSILQALYTDSGIGIVLPKEHILPMTDFFGANCDTVCALTARLGLPVCKLNELPLVAGSMFWARVEALIPLLMLCEEGSFEKEHGQLDGTFAHAFERMVSISAASIDLKVTDTDLQPYTPSDSPRIYEFASIG